MNRRIGKYIVERLGEGSTWVGLGSMATAIGWSIAPEHWMLISQFGMGLGGLMAAVLSDS